MTAEQVRLIGEISSLCMEAKIDFPLANVRSIHDLCRDWMRLQRQLAKVDKSVDNPDGVLPGQLPLGVKD